MNSKQPCHKTIIELFDSGSEFTGYLKYESEEFINGPHQVRGYNLSC